ncbi:hypothetical protein D3C79_627710 [compost metagenome]
MDLTTLVASSLYRSLHEAGMTGEAAVLLQWSVIVNPDMAQGRHALRTTQYPLQHEGILIINMTASEAVHRRLGLDSDMGTFRTHIDEIEMGRVAAVTQTYSIDQLLALQQPLGDKLRQECPCI